jgi:hypothetical protein
MIQIFKTAYFEKQYKKLHASEQDFVDRAMAEVISNPLLGSHKRGDLQGLRVHKFRMNHQVTLIAYRYLEIANELRFISVGPHENFYRDLKH